MCSFYVSHKKKTARSKETGKKNPILGHLIMKREVTTDTFGICIKPTTLLQTTPLLL